MLRSPPDSWVIGSAERGGDALGWVVVAEDRVRAHRGVVMPTTWMPSPARSEAPPGKPFASARLVLMVAASLETLMPSTPFPEAVDFPIEAEAPPIPIPLRAFPEAVDDVIEAKAPMTKMPWLPLPEAFEDLIEAEAPEVYFGTECYGRQASATTKRLLLPGTRVRLNPEPATDRVDQYGRLLGYVVRAADGLNVNVQLVRVGAAAPYFYEGRRGRYAGLLERSALRARARKLGLWGRCPHTPYDPTQGVSTRR